jgi:alpha-glutamyl/putrescinyl thymine pyrophosphorylase clade 1
MRPLPTTVTRVFDSYWRFVAERHKIYLKRLAGEQPPWTADPILREYRFTNVFRAADRVSQYLIRHVISRKWAPLEPEEIVFRILLFKLFNSITTWNLFEGNLGIPSWRNFDETLYVRILDGAINCGTKIWNAAYMQNDLSNYAQVSPKKHPRYIRLLKEMMEDGVTEKLQKSRTYREAFDVLKTYPLHQDFIAMQHLTDINYSDVINFSENDFIAAGPGAIRGLRKCFGLEPTEAEAAKWIADLTSVQEDFFALYRLEPVTLFGRRLSLMDIQNCFCEVDKYSRVAHPELAVREGEKIRQKNIPKGPLEKPFFPAKWGINIPDKISV